MTDVGVIVDDGEVPRSPSDDRDASQGATSELLTLRINNQALDAE
jgi:hypothetical protein